MRTTLKAVNKALAAAGIDAELVKGRGYFYFAGSAVDYAEEQGVYGVYRLSELTVSQWVEEARQRIEKPVVNTVEQLKDLPPGSYIVSGEAAAELARQFAKRFD